MRNAHGRLIRSLVFSLLCAGSLGCSSLRISDSDEVQDLLINAQAKRIAEQQVQIEKLRSAVLTINDVLEETLTREAALRVDYPRENVTPQE